MVLHPVSHLLRRAWIQTTFLGYSVVVIFPMVWLLYTAFKSTDEIFASAWSLPAVWQLDNFVEAWNEAQVGEFFWNSIFVTVSTLVPISVRVEDGKGGMASNGETIQVNPGVNNQLDIIAALDAAVYLTGPYHAIAPNGQTGDGQTSVGYNATTGEVWVDAPAGTDLTSINIDSAAGIFTGDAAANLGGSFDNDADNNIFKATFVVEKVLWQVTAMMRL